MLDKSKFAEMQKEVEEMFQREDTQKARERLFAEIQKQLALKTLRGCKNAYSLIEYLMNLFLPENKKASVTDNTKICDYCHEKFETEAELTSHLNKAELGNLEETIQRIAGLNFALFQIKNLHLTVNGHKLLHAEYQATQKNIILCPE